MMSFWVVPAQPCDVGRLLFRDYVVKGEQPHGGRVDGHAGVALLDRNAVEKRSHVADVRDRHTDPADLAAGSFVVRVVSRLGRQVEGHR